MCKKKKLFSYHHRFHEVMAQRALMRAVPSLRENGNDMYTQIIINLPPWEGETPLPNTPPARSLCSLAFAPH